MVWMHRALVRGSPALYRTSPHSDPTAPAATGYRTVLMRRPGETIAPLARPEATIAVADLLP